MANLSKNKDSAWKSIGFNADGKFFTGFGRVISKERRWSADKEAGNVVYYFTVFDEASKSTLSFSASTSFPDCARAKICQRICYEYISGKNMLLVNLTITE